MAIGVKLRYTEDSEGIEVLVFPSDTFAEGTYRMAVGKNEQLIAVCYARSLEDAQVLARLLVGVEIQPDGAAWKRGPRPPARATDHEGNIIPECKHAWTRVHDSVQTCSKCGKVV